MVHGHDRKLNCNGAIFSPKMSRILNLENLLWCLILISFVLLNSCSTVRKDGPPPFDVDVSNIPDATPKKEALSKYGNMPVYRVKGESYYPLKTASHYEERGIASWYGMRFHSQRTSSGERYDLLGMTAAHKTLPLPTYVEVTNLRNGRKVIVKVNDRGPFASNRIIDLSYVAAKKLGMLGRGTAYVEVKAIDFYHRPPHVSVVARNNAKSKLFTMNHNDSAAKMYLQVGAFKNRMYAERLKKRLMPMVSSPIVITQLSPLSHHLYRVQIGPIRDVAEADTLSKKLRAIGLMPKNTKV